jgi:uncharacterized cupin superfamily protein
MNTISTATVSTNAEDVWEPFVLDGQQVGEVRWIAQDVRPQGPLAVGLWRIDPEAGADLPYAVAGSETIHVLEGEAELEQADGTTIPLTPGVIITLPDGFTATWRTLSPFKKLFVVA